MKLCILMLSAVAGIAQTITFTSTDSRCTGSPITCTFDAISDTIANPTTGATGGAPNDYGALLSFTTTGGGNWTPGAESGGTCTATLFGLGSTAWTPNSPPPAITTISGSGTIVAFSLQQAAATCAPGSTFSHTITWTNGGGSYMMTLAQKTEYRLAAPVFFNNWGCSNNYSGCSAVAGGLADAALAGSPYNMTVGTPAANSFIYDLNLSPCPDCAPGGAFRMPASGSKWVDAFNSQHTVISDPGFVTFTDVQNNAFNADDSFVVAYSLGNTSCSVASGQQFLFSVASSTGCPKYILDTADTGNSVWSWDLSIATRIYGHLDGGSFVGSDTPFTQANLTGGAGGPSCVSAKCYSMGGAITCAGYTPSIFCAAYSTYGRFFNTDDSHQGTNSLGWRATITRFEVFGTSVTVSGTAITWSSGPKFDTNKMLDQVIGINCGASYGSCTQFATIASCADNQHCTATQTQTAQASPVAILASIPWQVFVWKYTDMAAQGASYQPIVGDLTMLARPRLNGAEGTPVYMSPGLLPTGTLAMQINQNPNAIIGTFTPGVSASITLSPGIVKMPTAGGDDSYQTGSYFDSTKSILIGSNGATATYLYDVPHATSLSTSDGKQWMENEGGVNFNITNFAGIGANQAPLNAAGGGNFTALNITQSNDEIANAQGAPYFIESAYVDGTSPVLVPTWTGIDCAGATGIGTANVLNLHASSPTGFNTTTNKLILPSNIVGNTSCNGSRTITAVSGTNADTLTLDNNANGAFATSPLAAAVADVAIAAASNTEGGIIKLCRELCQEVHRYGPMRTVVYFIPGQGAEFYAIGRASLSRCASHGQYTTNGGLVQNYQVIVFETGIHGCGMTTRMFDQSHAIVSATATGSTVTVKFQAPSANNFCIEIGAMSRFVDVACSGSSPDATYASATDSTGTVGLRTVNISSALTTGQVRVTDFGKNVMAWNTFPFTTQSGSLSGKSKTAGESIVH